MLERDAAGVRLHTRDAISTWSATATQLRLEAEMAQQLRQQAAQRMAAAPGAAAPPSKRRRVGLLPNPAHFQVTNLGNCTPVYACQGQRVRSEVCETGV